ncbi:MAG: tRNA (adenosine(37)-N6)-threonylcarbamoyltransferase complex dimerization subunit type 1 TsaB [Planctomycetes bacterium]|nr:tRNA (adenosine(37)-N6)-threonylcarbamoyltransferase complex dimerization subunit type 1 TsaB [Planctomycetota bacterium]
MLKDKDMDNGWLLALESSTAHGGAALLRGGKTVAVHRLPEGLRHGRDLLPAAAELLASQSLAAADLACIAVSAGPGSYTGIRVGVMAAKSLAYGAKIPLTAVSSLAGAAATLAAANLVETNAAIAVIQDARRDEVYYGVYRFNGDGLKQVVGDMAVTPEEAAAMTASLGRDIHLVGSGVNTYERNFAAVAGNRHQTAIDPAAIGWLGWRQFLQEQFADPLQIQPVYLRRDADADWRKDALITGS